MFNSPHLPPLCGDDDVSNQDVGYMSVYTLMIPTLAADVLYAAIIHQYTYDNL